MGLGRPGFFLRLREFGSKGFRGLPSGVQGLEVWGVGAQGLRCAGFWDSGFSKEVRGPFALWGLGLRVYGSEIEGLGRGAGVVRLTV